MLHGIDHSLIIHSSKGRMKYSEIPESLTVRVILLFLFRSLLSFLKNLLLGPMRGSLSPRPRPAAGIPPEPPALHTQKLVAGRPRTILAKIGTRSTSLSRQHPPNRLHRENRRVDKKGNASLSVVVSCCPLYVT